jgi:LuxR family transcriptional regulator, maltose regulon positive regulatory protein
MTWSTTRRRNGAPWSAHRRSASAYLLSDKVAPPCAAFPVLLRPRLFARLDAGAHGRVTVLDAPAGSGKTTLLHTWLDTEESPPSSWLSLGREDNDPQVFWSGVLESLRRSRPAAAGPLSDLVVPEPGGTAFVARFVEEMSRLPEPVVLVLDDAHELQDQTLLAGMEVLLRHTPGTLRLVLSGRRRPAVPLARLRVAGDVTDLGFDDLACDADEAEQLLGRLGADLSGDEVAVLLARTEGWMTGLRLAAQWWRSQPPGSRDVGRFSGRVRYVADYLDDEVLPARDPAARQFLLRTCLVESVHGALADALTGDRDGFRRLDELERENALVTAIDPARTWFRYRHLLRDFLRGELERIRPDEISELHRRAARWYAGHGDVVAGVRSALAADDAGFASQLLVDHGHRLLAAGQAASLGPLLRRFPADRFRTDAQLAALRAHAYLRTGHPRRAEPYLRIAEPPPGTDRQDGEDQLAAEVRYADLRLVHASVRGQVGREEIRVAEDVLRRADEAGALPGQQDALGRLALHLGLAHVQEGNGIAAQQALERAMHQLDDGAHSLQAVNAGAWHLLLNATEGRLAAVEQEMSALPAPPGTSDRADVAPLLDLAQALVWIERDRLLDAWTMLGSTPAFARGLPLGEGGEVSLAAGAALFRARVLIARGAYPFAREELAAVRRLGPTQHAHLRHGADLLETEILSLEGRTEEARRLLDCALAEHPSPDHALNAVAAGRLRLAEADGAGALAAVTPCLDGRTTETRLLDTVDAHLVAAAAHRRLGASGRAREHLEEALLLAEPDGLLRVFLHAGRTTRSMLTVMIPSTGRHAHMRATLLQRFDTQPGDRAQSSPQAATLTESETAVLTYLPSRLTNREIAQDMCLSVNTIKTHLRTLYRKLGVTSRREATVTARQLGLLP